MKDQHRHFSEAYAAGASGKDAAIKAGYSPGRAKQTASKLLRRPDVSSHVTELQEARAAAYNPAIGSGWYPGKGTGSWLWPDSAHTRPEKGSDGITRPVRKY